MKLPEIKLKKGEERRVRAVHAWIFSNEIDISHTPLDKLEPGESVVFRAHSGNILGTGYVNPHSLICGRVVSRDPAKTFGPALIHERIKRALAQREDVLDTPFYRLVFSESDGLPGLIVDRYGELLVIQIGTAGMERQRDNVVNALREVLNPTGILMRNDIPSRALEGLPNYVEPAWGTVPENVLLTENGARFQVSLHRGQKTGWFYDHRSNRELMTRLVGTGRILDVFGYLGAWAIQALTAGAEQATCIESSATALALIDKNAHLNDCAEKLEVLNGDAFDELRKQRNENRKYDMVVVDPPAFIKRRKDIRNGTLAYKRINQAAMRLVRDGGILISSSCSAHLTRDAFRDMLRRSAIGADVELRVLAQGGNRWITLSIRRYPRRII